MSMFFVRNLPTVLRSVPDMQFINGQLFPIKVSVNNITPEPNCSPVGQRCFTWVG